MILDKALIFNFTRYMDLTGCKLTITNLSRCIIVAAALLLLTTAAFAQRYPFHNLNVDDGLIQSQATCLAQDKTGHLWIGTLGGLSRFDGRNFTNYTIRNGMHSNYVRAVAADSTGNLWIGGESDISMFNGRTFIHYPKQQQQTARGINSSQQIQIVKDTTWWRVSGDVYYVTKGKINNFVTPGNPGFVSAIHATSGDLWMAKAGAVYHCLHEKCDTLRFNTVDDQQAPYVSRIFKDKDNVMWIGTNAGLYKIDSGRLVPVPIFLESLAAPPSITAIAQDRAGALWLGTSKGVLKATGNIYQAFNKHNGLSDNSFFDVLTDAEGNIWMASDGQGVFRFSGTQFAGLDETMGLPSAQVMAITSYHDSLVIGTYDAGLFIFNSGKVSPLSFPSNPVPSITSLCYTKSKLWIGTRGRGLWTYDRGVFRQYEAPMRHFPSNFINRLYPDPERRLWIGFANGALLYEHDSFKTVHIKNESVVSFLYIGKDSVLIATGNGLKLYHAGAATDFETDPAIAKSKVQCFILQGRELWLGSSDNGIARYNLDTRKTQIINKAAGLRSDFIYNIIADNDSNIWAGTGYGIHKIRIGPQDEPQVTFYGKAQGITGMESNINAVIKLADGSIWFGTTNGALHYQPHTAVVSSAPASIVLQSVKLTDENTIDPSYYDSTETWYSIPHKLRLPFKKNNIAFTFQAISLSGAQQVQYRYRMEGLDAPWSQWSPTNSVSYSALPPGAYTFHVQCQGAGGQSNPELAYSFEIITPFQKTKWFRIAVLAACLITGILLQYIVNSHKQRRLRLLAKLRAEEQSKIRLRTAEDFHDEIGNKLTRINVLTSVLKNKIILTPETTRILTQIEDNTGQLYGGTRDILWSLKPSNDNLYEILHRIRDFGGELFEDTDVDFIFTGTDEKWRQYRLPMDMSRNLIMIFKEALNNSLKYSNAKTVSLDVHFKNRGILQMVLKDDGQGFDMHTVKKGNGINNMNVRAGRLSGKIYIDSRKGKGTIINLTFKLPPKHK
jgi:ligand-binding sensor domain-containing protein/signal transduction histidine kinase